ncbi:MAG: glycosyltransferase [Rhizobacter sp.]|nr:glycosyltransferase [Chlorobiales bacterium]
MTLLLFYNCFITLCLCVFVIILVKNLFDLKPLPRAEVNSETQPRISILVPARNEAANISRCALSLLRQDYANFEVIVLNDNSDDGTDEVLEGLQQLHPHLKVIAGTPLPDGWLGKCWACKQLADASTGEYLLFTDADTMHEPASIKRALAAMQTSKADLLSIITDQEMKTVWERLVIPLIHFSVLCYLPVKLIWTNKSPLFAFANGQFLFFNREMYKKIGGHEAVRTAMVEDVWFVKAVKAAGGTVKIYDGIDAVRCRMYRSLKDVWQGFSKNIFAGLGYNVLAIAVLCIFSFAVYVLPSIFVLISLYRFLAGAAQLTPDFFWFPLLQLFIAAVLRVLIAKRFRLPVAESLLHPLSMLMFIGIALNSVRWIASGKGSLWKGRRYNFSNAATTTEKIQP